MNFSPPKPGTKLWSFKNMSVPQNGYMFESASTVCTGLNAAFVNTLLHIMGVTRHANGDRLIFAGMFNTASAPVTPDR